ncbi:MAG TPA: hypothetical protein VJH65_01090 [Candidatus Nanoarchaeia archaeon]|nr:hypothetical protein [Candidatus Nanoarchaeia archaeon]
MKKDKVYEKSVLKEMKKDYAEFQKKYNLPSFEKLNEYFSIEKAADYETDFLLREIRKHVADRLQNYMRFIEALLHPTDVPIFIFSIIKSLGTGDMEKLVELYKELAKMNLKLIKLDISYSEQKEAELIKESYKLWEKIKNETLDILKVVEKNWDSKMEFNGRSYFS